MYVVTNILGRLLPHFRYCLKIADVLKNYLEDNPNDYPQDPDERTAVHEVLRILRKAFGTGIHGEANNLRDKRAQIAMDIMQGVGDLFVLHIIRVDTS